MIIAKRSEATRVALRAILLRLSEAVDRADSELIEPEWELAENQLAIVALEVRRLERILSEPAPEGVAP